MELMIKACVIPKDRAEVINSGALLYPNVPLYNNNEKPRRLQLDQKKKVEKENEIGMKREKDRKEKYRWRDKQKEKEE